MRDSAASAPVLNAIFTQDSFLIEALHTEYDASMKALKLAFDQAPNEAYIKPCENRAYWIAGEQKGSVSLWGQE